MDNPVAFNVVTELIMTALTYTIAGASGVTGLPRTTIYNLLAKGELVAKKAGRRTLVTAASVGQYLDRLPVAAIKQPKT